MCGRYARGRPADEIADLFDVDDQRTDIEPSWNVAPTEDVAVLLEAEDGDRVLDAYRWGLVPHWSDGPDSQYSMINAREETAHEKPAYRGPFQSKRCAVVATGFYEWREDKDGDKTPMHIRRKGSEPFVFAGLWDEWTDEEGELRIRSCTILTTEPNALMAEIHDRMPVVLREEALKTWLDPGVEDTDQLRGVLGPWSGDEWTAYPVSTRVNTPTNDGPDLAEAVSG